MKRYYPARFVGLKLIVGDGENKSFVFLKQVTQLTERASTFDVENVESQKCGDNQYPQQLKHGTGELKMKLSDKAIVFFPQGVAFLLSVNPVGMLAAWKMGDPEIDASLTPEAEGAIHYLAINMNQYEEFRQFLLAKEAVNGSQN